MYVKAPCREAGMETPAGDQLRFSMTPSAAISVKTGIGHVEGEGVHSLTYNTPQKENTVLHVSAIHH